MSNYKHMSKSGNTKRTTGSKRKLKGGKTNKDSKSTLERFDAATATNDPCWYGNDASLLRDSASIPFSHALGTPFDLHNAVLDLLPNKGMSTVPGICALRTAPAIGRASNPSDPLNTAMFRMWSYTRQMNTGARVYDGPDFMLYLLSMTQIYAYINYLQRAYGCVYFYSQKNRYTPTALLEAMSIDAQDVRDNLAAFRYGINTLINKAASFYVPNTMSIFERHAFLYQNIYIGGNTMKDQMYMYTPSGFWKYTLDTDNETYAGMLEFDPIGIDDRLTVQQLLDYGNNMLDRLIQSEDINTMSGDVRKTFGPENCIKLTSLPTEYPIIPITDLAVLQQMKNATVIPVDNESMAIRQDEYKHYLVFEPSRTLTYTADDYHGRAKTYCLQSLCEDRILTVSSPEPTPEEIMESTRCMSIPKDYKRADNALSASVQIYPCSEIVTDCLFYYYDVDSNGVPMLSYYNHPYYSTVDSTNKTSLISLIRGQSIGSNFKYRPARHVLMYKAGTEANTFNVTDAYMNFDVDNYTIITPDVLHRMHEAAILSLLAVPFANKV